MSLKNFVVTTQRVKSKSDGLIQYVNYLDNEKAPSHKNTKIINFGSASDDFLKNTNIHFWTIHYFQKQIISMF